MPYPKKKHKDALGYFTLGMTAFSLVVAVFFWFKDVIGWGDWIR